MNSVSWKWRAVSLWVMFISVSMLLASCHNPSAKPAQTASEGQTPWNLNTPCDSIDGTGPSYLEEDAVAPLILARELTQELDSHALTEDRPFVDPHYDGANIDLSGAKPYLVGYLINGQKVGVWVTRWMDARTPQTYELYKAGKQDGIFVRWNNVGSIVEVGHYSSGNRSGLWLVWHDNGVLQRRCYYRDDLLHGVETCWFESGTRQYERQFENGVSMGRARYWHRNGTQHIQLWFKDGSPHGTFDEWAENGTRTACGSYVAGKPVGLWREWNEAGELIAEVMH